MKRAAERLGPVLRLGLLLSFWALLVPSAAARAAGPPATIDDVIVLARNDISEETILAFVRNRTFTFTGGADEILRLRDAGVSEKVIQALLDNASGGGVYAPVTGEDDTSLLGDSAGYVESAPAYTSSYVSSSYYPLGFFPRTYYGSVYVGNIVYPRFWYTHRYHGVHFLRGTRHRGLRHLRRPRVFGKGFVVTDDEGFEQLRRHGLGFPAGAGGARFRSRRGVAFGAGTVRHPGAGFGGFRGGAFEGARGGVHGGTPPGFTPGMGAAFPGGTRGGFQGGAPPGQAGGR